MRIRLGHKHKIFLVVTLGCASVLMGARHYFLSLADTGQLPVSINQQFDTNPLLQILGVNDQVATNSDYWSNSVQGAVTDMLQVRGLERTQIGNILAGEFTAQLELPADVVIWQVFQNALLYTLPDSPPQLTGWKDGRQYVLDTLGYTESYHSVLFHRESQLVFVVYQYQVGDYRLKFIRPQGGQVDVYRFLQTQSPQLISYDDTNQSILIRLPDTDKYYRLNLVSKEMVEIASLAVDAYRVTPPALSTYSTPEVQNAVIDPHGTQLFISEPGKVFGMIASSPGELLVMERELIGPLEGLYVTQDAKLIWWDLSHSEVTSSTTKLPIGEHSQLFTDEQQRVYMVVGGLGGVETLFMYDSRADEWEEINLEMCVGGCRYSILSTIIY